VDPDLLQTNHDQIKRNIEIELRKQLPSSKTSDEIVTRCGSEVDNLFVTVKENNEKNQPTFLRKAMKTALKTAVGAATGFFFSPPGILSVLSAVAGGLGGLIRGILDK